MNVGDRGRPLLTGGKLHILIFTKNLRDEDTQLALATLAEHRLGATLALSDVQASECHRGPDAQTCEPAQHDSASRVRGHDPEPCVTGRGNGSPVADPPADIPVENRLQAGGTATECRNRRNDARLAGRAQAWDEPSALVHI